MRILVSKASRRYALALLETAKEKNIVKETLEDVHTIKSTIEGSRELKLFLKSPLVKPRDKRAALATIFDKKISPNTTQFLSLITEKGRENILHDIVQAFVDEYNQYAGIITVGVKTAYSLSQDQFAGITKNLEKVTSKKVDLDVKVQPDLIGGISVQIDDTVYDATIKHKLDQLETRLLANATE